MRHAGQRAGVAEAAHRDLRPETGDLIHPLLERREEKRVLVVVVSGDKGFAGAFNANIIKATLHSWITRATSRSTLNP